MNDSTEGVNTDIFWEQHQTGLVALQKLIIETCPFVDSECFHILILAQIKENGRDKGGDLI